MEHETLDIQKVRERASCIAENNGRAPSNGCWSVSDAAKALAEASRMQERALRRFIEPSREAAKFAAGQQQPPSVLKGTQSRRVIGR